MFRSIAAPALAAVISFAAVSEAGAWTRSGSFTGPRGTSNWGASRSCAGGACSWNGGGSGPRGSGLRLMEPFRLGELRRRRLRCRRSRLWTTRRLLQLFPLRLPLSLREAVGFRSPPPLTRSHHAATSEFSARSPCEDDHSRRRHRLHGARICVSRASPRASITICARAPPRSASPLGRNALRGVEALIVAGPYAFAYEHRLFDFDPTSALALVALFLGVEFFYYWDHRASHRVRWMWATHSVHHSPTRMNYTAAVRLGWTAGPLRQFSVLPAARLARLSSHRHRADADRRISCINSSSTRSSARAWALLEHVLNTPAHHRVHHASNASCLDRNYGGVLIVFDRLFGTFAEAPKEEALRYGLVGATPSFNPLKIALGEWAAMFRDAGAADDWRGALRHCSRRPARPT